MPSRLFLEEFDNGPPRPGQAPSERIDAADRTAPEFTAEAVDRARLEGYEAGYKAGWEDAVRAEAETQGRIGAEFARNLQDLGFTFHEARSHVMQALEPLLTGMVERVLPELVSRTVGQTIVEELLPLASQAAGTPIEVVISPASREALEPLLEKSAIPLTIVEEPTLAEGQVFLRAGKTEHRIDFVDAVDRIGAAINALYELNEKAFRNG